jgi:hypothetical protein
MSPATVFPSDGFFASIVRGDDVAKGSASKPQHDSGAGLPDPYANEPKWAAWKVTLFVILFCGAFWAGIAWLVMRLFA